MSDPKVTADRLRELRALFDAALEDLLTGIATAATPEDAWVAVEELQDELEKPMRTRVKEARADVARRIYNERDITLAKLAVMAGVSRGRAGQIVGTKESRDAT